MQSPVNDQGNEHCASDENFEKDASAFEELLEIIQDDPDLKVLDLSSSGLTWRHIQRLCSALEVHDSVTNLDVSDNSLGPFEGSLELSKYLQKEAPPAVTKLNISSAAMDDEAILAFTENIVDNPNLRSLSFDSNFPFTPVAMHAIGNLVCNMSLTELCLSDLQIDCDGARVLGETVMHSPSLITLSLDINLMQFEGGVALGEMIGVNRVLKRLDLGHNRLRAEGISELLCEDALKNTALTALNLSRNFCQGIDHIAGFPQNLAIVNFNYNNLNVPGAVKLSHLLSEATTQVQMLYLQHNLIGDDGCCVLADALNDNQKLKILDLSDNMITIKGLMYLTAMLSINTTLQRLTLSNNEKLDDNGFSMVEDNTDHMLGIKYIEFHECSMTHKNQKTFQNSQVNHKFVVSFSEYEDAPTDSDDDDASEGSDD